MRVSVVVNTKNEELSLDRCLRSAAWADEIIVLDMSSEDGTVEVARRHTDKVFSCPDFGYVEPARNLAISHATGDWVFVLDADEVIPPRLGANVRRIIEESEGFALVAIPRWNYIGDYAIKNSGWGADFQPRLFRRGLVTWTDAIHSWPQVDGEIRYLSPDSGYYIKHYNYSNLSDFVARLNRYTSVEAEALVRRGDWASWRDIVREAVEEFGKRYTPKEDGFHSLALAGCMAFYRFIARCKQVERIREAEADLIFPLPESPGEIAAEVCAHLAPGPAETQAGARTGGAPRRPQELEEELARVHAAYEAQIATLNRELSDARAGYEAQIGRLNEELSGARARYEKQIGHLGEELEHERGVYEARLSLVAEESARERAGYEAELKRLADELSGARAEASDSARELARVRRGYDEQVARRDEELAAYEAQFARLNAELEALSESLADREAELEQQVESAGKLRMLAERSEEILEWIQTSRSWRLASRLRRTSSLLHRWRRQSTSLARGMRRPVFRGLIESPTEAATVAGELEIKGWVFSTAGSVCLVEAFLDDFYLGRLSYGVKRPDVAAAYSNEAPSKCGYSDRVALGMALRGPRKLMVRAYDTAGNVEIYTRHVGVGHSQVLPPAADSSRRKALRAAAPARPAAGDADPNLYSQVEALVNEFRGRAERDPTILNWNTGLNLAAAVPQMIVFSPPYTNGRGSLPYLDGSVDIVVVPAGDQRQLAEADRIASAAVVRAHGVGAARPGDGAEAAAAPGGQRIRLVAEWKDGVVGEAPLPGASIIIPVYNKVEYTEKCLARVLETLPNNFGGEIVVVDDASSDETPQALERWARKDERIRVLRNERNEGFIFSCNRGAGAARGEVLVFLNNDTLPLPGWLPPLLRLLRDRPDAGAVGGKLLYPDGTLQEAGGVIFSDATGCNFGRKDKSPNSPLYSFVREVDYCSGALLATPRALFQTLGGFDTRYAPAYYEDTDYCFSLREAGRKVYYQPESVIVHFEGVSSGTDLKSGVKKYQAANRLKFIEKWRHVLAGHPKAPSNYDFVTLHALSVRDEPRNADEN